MIRIIRPFALVLALAAAAAAACSANGQPEGPIHPDPVEGVAGNVAHQRQIWGQQDIDDYRVVYGRTCFCVNRGTFQVTVRDGRVAEVRQENGDLVPQGDAVAEYLTVEDLFDRIVQAEARNEYTAVKYHPELGYPVEAEIGTLANDAGTRHTLTGLVRID